MVTGDQREVAEAVAAEIGIDRVEAGVFPERKAEIVRELQAAGHVVAVIGDGLTALVGEHAYYRTIGALVSAYRRQSGGPPTR